MEEKAKLHDREEKNVTLLCNNNLSQIYPIVLGKG